MLTCTAGGPRCGAGDGRGAAAVEPREGGLVWQQRWPGGCDVPHAVRAVATSVMHRGQRFLLHNARIACTAAAPCWSIVAPCLPRRGVAAARMLPSGGTGHSDTVEVVPAAFRGQRPSHSDFSVNAPTAGHGNSRVRHKSSCDRSAAHCQPQAHASGTRVPQARPCWSVRAASLMSPHCG